MPYVNIPDSGLGGATAKIVGKIQGKITAQVLKQAANITNKLNRDGCPTRGELARLRQQKQQLDSAIGGISDKLSRFQKLPQKLKSPLSGFKAALKIILSLPIPQSVPPGFGLPINITTKYADVMHLLKEFIKQIDEVIVSIETVLDTPSTSLSSIQRILSRADSALKICELGDALEKEVENGNITQEELINIGLYDRNGAYRLQSSNIDVFGQSSNRKFRGKWQSGVEYNKNDITKYNEKRWVCQKDHISDAEGGKETGPPGVGPWKSEDSLADNASTNLLNSLQTLNDSSISDTAKKNIKDLLNTFKAPAKTEILDNTKFYHTGPDGQVYVLEILNDPESPQIAPRRFAIASTTTGIVKLKGPKSFSSSIEVLLEEIKFRIDNQLP